MGDRLSPIVVGADYGPNLVVRGAGMPTYSRRPSTETTIPFGVPDLIVFSHLRWSWVWQRPQQLMSRLSASHHMWFSEEPVVHTDTGRARMWWAERTQT